MGLIEWLKGLGPERTEPGVYKFDGTGGLKGHRFHLRVDSEEKGVLIVDASKMLFLNGTAVDHMFAILEGMDDEGTVRYIKKRYKGVRSDAILDHSARIRDQLRRFIQGDMSVVEVVGAGSPTIGADDLPSPYRMDLALTYECQNRCGHCYNEARNVRPLGEGQWYRIIDKLWDIGIPHIIFTGGEPTLVPFLKGLIERSEMNGQITGIITNGRQFREPGYLNGLVRAGLDHAQITVLSHKESVHDRLAGSEGAWKQTIEGLKLALKEDLYVNTNTTIMRSTIGDVKDTARSLMDMGVKNIAFNGIIRAGKGKSVEGVTFEELTSALIGLKGMIEGEGARMIWYSPTPYCEFNPVNLGLGIKQCTACSINMAIEPDGTVIPCQSFYEGLGNILEDEWSDIWEHKICRRVRKRKYVPVKCRDCGLLEACGAGCPLSVEHGSYLCGDRASTM